MLLLLNFCIKVFARINILNKMIQQSAKYLQPQMFHCLTNNRICSIKIDLLSKCIDQKLRLQEMFKWQIQVD